MGDPHNLNNQSVAGHTWWKGCSFRCAALSSSFWFTQRLSTPKNAIHHWLWISGPTEWCGLRLILRHPLNCCLRSKVVKFHLIHCCALFYSGLYLAFSLQPQFKQFGELCVRAASALIKMIQYGECKKANDIFPWLRARLPFSLQTLARDKKQNNRWQSATAENSQYGRICNYKRNFAPNRFQIF